MGRRDSKSENKRQELSVQDQQVVGSELGGGLPGALYFWKVSLMSGKKSTMGASGSWEFSIR